MHCSQNMATKASWKRKKTYKSYCSIKKGQTESAWSEKGWDITPKKDQLAQTTNEWRHCNHVVVIHSNGRRSRLSELVFYVAAFEQTNPGECLTIRTIKIHDVVEKEIAWNLVCYTGLLNFLSTLDYIWLYVASFNALFYRIPWQKAQTHEAGEKHGELCAVNIFSIKEWAILFK